MSRWYNQITDNPDDITALVDAIVWFENELNLAKDECKISGSLEKSSAMLPGIVEHRYRQYQEVEAILKFLELRMNKIWGTAFKKYLEQYQKSLSSRDAEKYADADDSVIQISMLINQVALLRNHYQGIMKSLEYKHFQIGHLVKLKCAGLEDYSVD